MRLGQMMALMAAMLVGVACEEPTQFNDDFSVEVTFPEGVVDSSSQDGSLVLPLNPQTNSFFAEVHARIPRLNGAPLAELVVDAPKESGAEGRSVTLRLAQVGEAEEYRFEGKVELRAPAPGPVRVRASVVGKEAFAEAVIRPPAVSIGQTPVLDGWLSAVPRFQVCIETTAKSGHLEVRAEGATLLSMPADGNVGLEPGKCSDGGTAQSRAKLFVTTAAPSFVLHARLKGTTADDVKSLNANVGKLRLQLTTEPPEMLTLPDAGSLIRLVGIVTHSDSLAPIPNIPVQFQVIPTATILPENAVTDGDGKAYATLLVPKDITSLRIDVIAGHLRSGMSLSR